MLQKCFHNLTLGLFFIIIGAAFLLGIFSNNAYSINLSAPAMILGCCLFCLLSSLILHRCKSLNDQLIYPITGILFLLQLIFLLFIITSVGWDCGILVSGARNDISHANDKITHYLSIYPNNLLLFYLERNLFRLNRFLHLPLSGFTAMDIINILCLDGTILFTSLTAGKLINKKCILPCYYITACILGFSPWIIIPYSDTLGMIFPILSFYCYLCSKDKITFPKQILLLCTGILFGVGYLIKPTAIIALIAIIIYELCEIFSKKNSTDYLGFLKIVPTVIIGVVLTLTLFQYYSSDQTDLKLNSNIRTPLSHFLVLGTHYSVRKDGKELFGTYNDNDVTEMLHCPTTKEKDELSWAKLKARMESFGLNGYCQFLYNKFRWITGDGMFSWGIEGHFIKEHSNAYSVKHSLLKEAYYPNGKYINITTAIFQSIWLTILLACVISCFYYRNLTTLSIPRLTCLGTILFILLFEGRARYLIICIPYFCLLASAGITSLFFPHTRGAKR